MNDRHVISVRRKGIKYYEPGEEIRNGDLSDPLRRIEEYLNNLRFKRRKKWKLKYR
jgi:hypothetical protein